MNQLYVPSSRITTINTNVEQSYDIAANALGVYRIECWGAQGGGPNGGRGGYSRGYIRVDSPRTLYCYSGRQPSGATGGWTQGKTLTMFGGSSTNPSYFAGGGMSYITLLKYRPPIEVIPVNTEWAGTALGTYTFGIGIATSSTVGIRIYIDQANHIESCIHMYLLKNGQICNGGTFTKVGTGQVQQCVAGHICNGFGGGEYEVQYDGVAEPGDIFELRVTNPSGHGSTYKGVSGAWLIVHLTWLGGVASSAGDLFEPETTPLIVAGGGGGQGPLGNGSPSGTRISLMDKFEGLDSAYGGSGSGYFSGLPGTATASPGGGDNYGATILGVNVPMPIFNYRSEHGVNSGHGRIRISRISK